MIYDWTMTFLIKIGLPTLAMACVGLFLGLFIFREARPASKAVLIALTAYIVNVVRSALGVTVANFGWVGEAIYFAPGAVIFGFLYYRHLRKNWIDNSEFVPNAHQKLSHASRLEAGTQIQQKEIE